MCDQTCYTPTDFALPLPLPSWPFPFATVKKMTPWLFPSSLFLETREGGGVYSMSCTAVVFRYLTLAGGGRG